MSRYQVCNAVKLRGVKSSFENERVRRDVRWAEYQREAEEEYATLSQDPEFMFGLALYIGEGSKTSGNQLCLTNCDPRVIQKGFKFFGKIGVTRASMRCAIQIHPGLSRETAEVFWQKVTELPSHQFHHDPRSGQPGKRL